MIGLPAGTRIRESGIQGDRYPYVPDTNGPDHLAVIATELQKRGQPASVVEKILDANLQRIIREIWGGT